MKLLYGLLLLTFVQFAFSGRGVEVGETVKIVPNKNKRDYSAIPQILYRPPTVNRYSLGKKIDSYIR